METEDTIKKVKKPDKALEGPEGQLVQIGGLEGANEVMQTLSTAQTTKLDKASKKIGESLSGLEGHLATAKAADLAGMIPAFQIKKSEHLVGQATEIHAVLNKWLVDKNAPKARIGQLMKDLPGFVKSLSDQSDKLEELVDDAQAASAVGGAGA